MPMINAVDTHFSVVLQMPAWHFHFFLSKKMYNLCFIQKHLGSIISRNPNVLYLWPLLVCVSSNITNFL